MKFPLLLFIVFSAFTLAQSQEYAAIDNYSKTVELTTDFKAAAKSLSAPYTDDTSKVRAIFSWLAYHIEYDKKQLRKITRKHRKGPNEIKASSPEEARRKLLEKENAAMERALKKKKGVCQDYAWLFTAMLAEIGIEAEFIAGHGRTDPSSSSRYSKELGHAWNVAKIDGKWELFDVTWSTDMWDRDGGNGFFMMSPENFLRTHYPEDEKWQLVEKPMDIKSWAKQFFVYKGYECYNITAVMAGSDTVSIVPFPVDSIFHIDLTLPQGKTLLATKNQGQKSAELTRVGKRNSINFKEKKFKGTTTLVVSDGNQFYPLMDVKVR